MKFYNLCNLGALLNGLFFVYKKSLFLIELKGGDSLLDVGCGTGRIIHRLEKKYGNKVKIFGVDPSPEILQVAKLYNPNSKISFKVAYGSDLPFINNSMDWVISTLAFHHMPEDEKQKTIGETARILKPGGKFLISDFGRPNRFLGKIFAWFSKNHSYTQNNIEFVERVLAKNNFRIIKTAVSLWWIEHLLCQKL